MTREYDEPMGIFEGYGDEFWECAMCGNCGTGECPDFCHNCGTPFDVEDDDNEERRY